MQTVIQLTPEEYKELTEKQNEPALLLRQTITNQQEKIEQLSTKLDKTEAELSTYVLGGAKPKKPKEDNSEDLLYLCLQYNAISSVLGKQVKPVLEALSKHVQIPVKTLKTTLKTAVSENKLERNTQHNKYHVA